MADELRLTRIGDGLVVSIEGTDDSITASNFFYANDPHNGFNTLQEVRFADGSSWDRAALLKNKGLTGTAGADALFGSNWSDLISGLGGDDALYGLEGDDVIRGDGGNDSVWAGGGNDGIEGGEGSDTIYGESGDDVIDGGRGDDVLYGGMGNDVYLFGKGDGRDVIGGEYFYWWDGQSIGHNVLTLKSGVMADELRLTRIGLSLIHI